MYKTVTIPLLFFLLPSYLFATTLHQLISAEFKPKKYILSIGINHFQDKIFLDLAYAQNDAESVYHYFHNIGFNAELLSSPFVSLCQVNKVLARLEEQLKEEDTLIIYISSHGTRSYSHAGTLERYLVTSDTNSDDLPATALSFETLLRQFRSFKARKKALIMAFCHAGEGKSGLSEKDRQTMLYAKGEELPELSLEALSEGSFIYAASMQNQAAYENPELQHDVYTYFLLQAFKKSAELKTLARAHDFAAEHTHRFVYENLGRIQTPTATTAISGSPAICITKDGCQKNQPTIYAQDFRHRKFQLEINGVKHADLDKAITTSKGFNHIEVHAHGQKIYDDTIYLKEGVEYPINKFISSSKSDAALVGSCTLNFTNDKFRKKLASEPIRGLGLTYEHDNFLDLCDTSFSLYYFPWQKELLFYEDFAIEHKRQITAINLFFGKKHYLESLSLKSGSLLSYLRYHSGLSILQYQSQSPSPEFSEQLHAGFTPGPGLSLALETHLPCLELCFGYQFSLVFYQGAHLLTASAQTSQMFIGKYW